MWMRSAVLLCGLTLAVTSGAVSIEDKAPKQLWQVDGMQRPESMLLDEARQVIYVSNINGKPLEKNGAGYIARLSPDGKLLQQRWVEGLNAPKGMAVVGDTLYVSDIDTLALIDIASGRITTRYQVPQAKFLNDVIAGANGDVYVSDMGDDAIYRLRDGQFELWLRDPQLLSPNGLLLRGKQLVVGGKDTLKFVDLDSKAVTLLKAPWKALNLDGVESDGADGFVCSDWGAGQVYHISADGTRTVLLTLEQGSADIDYLPAQRLLLVPRMLQGAASAWSLPDDRGDVTP